MTEVFLSGNESSALASGDECSEKDIFGERNCISGNLEPEHCLNYDPVMVCRSEYFVT